MAEVKNMQTKSIFIPSVAPLLWYSQSYAPTQLNQLSVLAGYKLSTVCDH